MISLPITHIGLLSWQDCTVIIVVRHPVSFFTHSQYVQLSFDSFINNISNLFPIIFTDLKAVQFQLTYVWFNCTVPIVQSNRSVLLRWPQTVLVLWRKRGSFKYILLHIQQSAYSCKIIFLVTYIGNNNLVAKSSQKWKVKHQGISAVNLIFRVRSLSAWCHFSRVITFRRGTYFLICITSYMHELINASNSVA